MESACSCVRASVANVVGQLQLTLPAARALFLRAFSVSRAAVHGSKVMCNRVVQKEKVIKPGECLHTACGPCSCAGSTGAAPIVIDALVDDILPAKCLTRASNTTRGAASGPPGI